MLLKCIISAYILEEFLLLLLLSLFIRMFFFTLFQRFFILFVFKILLKIWKSFLCLALAVWKSPAAWCASPANVVLEILVH
jgi:hypothetical protein